eukprot:9283462-Pyramimonas_sp.AAC.1
MCIRDSSCYAPRGAVLVPSRDPRGPSPAPLEGPKSQEGPKTAPGGPQDPRGSQDAPRKPPVAYITRGSCYAPLGAVVVSS